jgi:hypothetical protein
VATTAAVVGTAGTVDGRGVELAVCTVIGSDSVGVDDVEVVDIAKLVDDAGSVDDVELTTDAELTSDAELVGDAVVDVQPMPREKTATQLAASQRLLLLTPVTSSP